MSEPSVDDVAELQRAMTRVCFDRAVSASDLALLGESAAVYRELVRSRLRDLVSVVLPRTEKALGRAATSALCEAFFAEAAPRSRFFREVIPELVAFALPRLPSDAPRFAADLMRFESTRWELGWRAAPAPSVKIVPFELERVPVAHPTLRLLALDHAVNRDGEPAEVATFISIHRRADDLVETRTLDATGFRLLSAWARGDRTAIDGVRAVLEEEQRAPDQVFVDRMGALLAALIESGAILGSRE